MRVLQTAAFAAFLGNLTPPVHSMVQDSESIPARGLEPEFWAIVGVGATLSAIGITCLVMLVGMNKTLGNMRVAVNSVEHALKDLKGRLTEIEILLKLRHKAEGDDDYVPSREAWLWQLGRDLSIHLKGELKGEMVSTVRGTLRDDLAEVVAERIADKLKKSDPSTST